MSAEQADDQRPIPVPLFTKLGIIGMPLIPTVIIDAIAGGGIAPPAIVGFVLSYLAWETSPKVLAALGKNEEFMRYLAAHPEHLHKLDKLSGSYFSKEVKRLGLLTTRADHEGQPQPKDEPPPVPGHQEAIPQEQENTIEPLQLRRKTPLLTGPDEETTELSQPRRAFSRLNFQANDVLAAAPVQAPSVPFFFSEVLKSFTPSLEQIYLATLPNGKPVFLKARDLCHTALAGATRGGKSHLIRQLMSQLCYAGANVYLLDPHYTRWDREARDPYGNPCPEDWTPFEAHLKNDPRELIPEATKYQVIAHYLQAAFEMTNKRLEQRGYSEPLGAPQFLVLDEVPSIVDEIPEAPRFLKRILREGAKVGVFVINASQDFQVETVFKEVGGGIRKCYRTAFDVGSDPATQRALGLPVVEAKRLGKGKTSLRCDEEASSAFVPYVDNAALYRLLGNSTYVPTDGPEIGLDVLGTSRKPQTTTGGSVVAHTGTRYHSHHIGPESTQQRRRERIMRLRSVGEVPNGDAKQSAIRDTRYAEATDQAENGPENELRGTRSLPPGWTERDVELAVMLYKNLGNKDTTLKAMGKSMTPDNRRTLTSILQEEGE